MNRKLFSALIYRSCAADEAKTAARSAAKVACFGRKSRCQRRGHKRKTSLRFKGIRNIRTKCYTGFSEKRDADDFICLGIWIDELQKNLEKPLVLYADKYALHLKSMDIFQSALMSPLQKDLLEYGQDTICIDSTHGTAAHDQQLTTLMVRGSNG